MMIRYGTLGYDAVRRLGFVSGLRLGPERFQHLQCSTRAAPPSLSWLHSNPSPELCRPVSHGSTPMIHQGCAAQSLMAPLRSSTRAAPPSLSWLHSTRPPGPHGPVSHGSTPSTRAAPPSHSWLHSDGPPELRRPVSHGSTPIQKTCRYRQPNIGPLHLLYMLYIIFES